MEAIALFGAGEAEQTVQYIQEIMSTFWSSVTIESVFFNNSAFWGKEIGQGIVIQRPSEIPNHRFDRLVICAEPVLCEELIHVLQEKLGIEEGRMIPYHKWLRFNIGMHQIEWDKVYRLSDVATLLQKCGTLNDCEDFYYNKPHRIVEKYAHYFEIYDRHFQKFRNTECVVVEVGVFRGASLQMWKDYFGSKAQIIGIDIDEVAAQYEEEQVTIEIGSQSDRKFWKVFKEKYPKVDILIDDGGHTMEQQIVTFEEMFHHLSEEGVYLCEDLHTSYWPRYGGGYKNPESFIEYSKNFVDYINAWYAGGFGNKYMQSMHSLHYYDSILVVEKRKINRSVVIPTGQ